jgi:4-aminobutyrate aminotransferase-like enzyme/Ser/Thr protein kinase RdoA (MazF antagonist)/murein DD-endopeptidase MepM/ murein hydrolase activator NlpD
MTDVNPFGDLALRCPPIDVDEAATIARDLFGREGAVRELGSNQDRNFRVDTPEGRYVLKIANPGWERVALEAQNAAMSHLAARGLPFAVPVPMASPAGNLLEPLARDGEIFDVRLVTYVDGSPLDATAYRSARALRAVGRIAGQTTRALTGFSHPGTDRTIQWDLRLARPVVDALDHWVREDDRRAQSRRLLETAEDLLAPLREVLPQQVVHADVTDYNVMSTCDPSGRMMPSGLIDFGDLMHTWRISDIATAVQSLVLGDAARALEVAVEVTRGFHEAVPLTDEEIAAVWPLILARAAVCAVCEEQQAMLEPDNPYAQDFLGDGWIVADGLEAVPPALAHESLRAALGLGPSQRSRAAAARLDEIAATAVPIVPDVPDGVLDLSVRGDTLRFGEWADPATSRRVIAEAGCGVGRWGEGRLVHSGPEQWDPPASVHLGADVFVAAGTPVSAPVAASVTRVGAWDVTLDCDGAGIRLAGIAPLVTVGQSVAQGETVGTVAEPGPSDPLPAHLHVQALASAELDTPGLAVPAQAAGWLALSPDPSPLLGRDCAAPRDDAAALVGRRDAVVARVQEHYYDEPPEIERGYRHHLYDTDGRVYLDMVNNVAVLGHSHPHVEALVARQLRFLNTNSRFNYELIVEASERVAALAPEGLDAVFWVASGSEANDLALRLIRCATRNRDVIAIQSAYHGWTGATDEISTALYDNPLAAERRPAWIHPVESPNLYRGTHRGADANERYVAEVTRVLAELAAAGTGIAGFIAEPVYGNAGGVSLPNGYLEAVFAAVRAAGGLCIADEVQVGYGRLGEHFWGFEQQGVVPDVITIAKATGNGFPVGAVITTREIAETFAREGAFFASTGGSPASCAAAVAVLDVLEREQLQENARLVGAHLRSRLEALVDRHPLCGAVHGMGLYLGLELVRDRDTLEPAAEEAYAICERMRELGIIIQPTSDGMNVLKIKPPLCLTEASADYFADTLDRVLETGW